MAHPVPIGEYQPQVPVEEGMRRIIPSLSGISAGPALEDVGNSLQRIATSEAAQKSTEILSQTQSEWTQKFIERQQSADPGAPGFTAGIMKEYDDYVKNAVKGAPAGLTQRFLNKQLTEFGRQLSQKSLLFEAQARQDHNENTARQSIDSSALEIQNDPSVLPQRLAERQAAISAMNMEPQVKEKLSLYAEKAMAGFAVQGDIERDPYKAMIALQDPKRNDYYQHLTADQRQQLMGHADQILHQRVADAERVHQLAKQNQEEAAKAVVKQGILLSQQGKLTPDWVTKHASVLEPSELATLYDWASGKKTESDPQVFADLYTRAGKGEDVTKDSRDALGKGQLSKEDWTRLQGLSDRALPDGFKQGSERIRLALQTSPLNPDPARAQSQANAVDDWVNWNRENPKATLEQQDKASEAIINRYQIISGEQTRLLLPVPAHLVGGRTKPDIPASQAALKKDYQAGKLTREQAEREAYQLEQWQHTLSNEQAAQQQPVKQ